MKGTKIVKKFGIGEQVVLKENWEDIANLLYRKRRKKEELHCGSAEDIRKTLQGYKFFKVGGIDEQNDIRLIMPNGYITWIYADCLNEA